MSDSSFAEREAVMSSWDRRGMGGGDGQRLGFALAMAILAILFLVVVVAQIGHAIK